jgi:hypothetical protein
MGDKRLREHQLQHVIWLQRPLGEDAELYLARSSKDHPNLGENQMYPLVNIQKTMENHHF